MQYAVFRKVRDDMARMKHAGNRIISLERGTESTQSKGVQGAYEWLEEIIAAVVIVVLIFTFLLRVVTVSGTSMYPNYHDGDRLIVTNTFGQPLEQGDVVVLVNVLEEPIIKRVIATENQVVDIDFETGTVYVDGQAVDESQFGLENGITKETATALEKTQFPAKVPEGHIFVLGDNRPVSEDSRYTAVGMVSVENVLGKAEFRLFPFDRFGAVE